MTTTIDAPDMLYASFPIHKWETADDGGIYVYGKATDASVDSDRQIVDSAWSGAALQKWMSSGPNVRVMHNPKLLPAGSGVELEVNKEGDGAHWVKSRIDEPIAVDLVKKGHLRAYSIGISRPVIERDMTGKAQGGIIKGNDLTEICELSLVDRPANRNCAITLVKSATGTPNDEVWDYGDLEALLLTKAEDAPDAEVQQDDNEKPSEAEDAKEEAAKKPEDDEDSEKAFHAAVAKWVSGEPAIGKASSGTDYLVARSAWQKWSAEGEEYGYAANDYSKWVLKRDFDRGVGGGTDRDKIPAKDFAGPNRSFPIVSPKDVADAARLVGHADNPDAVRARIKSIAQRKGPEFEARIPDSWKAEKAAGKTVQCENCNTYNDAGASKCKKCGEPLGDHPSEQPKKPGTKSEKAMKKGKKRMLPPNVKPAGEHREPDGTSTVEMLEPQAGLGTTPDATPDKVPASVKGASYGDRRMHDALCAAYSENAIKAVYPSLDTIADAVNPDFWFDAAAEADRAGKAKKTARLRSLADSAVAVKSSDPALLSDAHAELFKMFMDSYPNIHLTPGQPPQPGQFQRPFITTGHALMTPSGSANVPPASHVPNPGDYTRGPLMTGQERPSPANKGNLATSSVATGSVRSYYPNAARNATRVALQQMHDHIAKTYPDMCPLAPTMNEVPTDMNAKNRPMPVHPGDQGTAPGEKTITPDTIKSFITQEMTSLRDEYAAKIATYEETISKMQKEIDAWGSQADEREAPVRGATRKPVPVPVEKAEKNNPSFDEDAALRAYIESTAENSGNPGQREIAKAALAKFEKTS